MNSPAERLSKLVKRFESQEKDVVANSSRYQETEARVEFIDPLFDLLGWDMINLAGLSNGIKDVVREESQVTEVSTKKPDYTFRTASIRKFFVEAKRPAVDIRSDRASAFQVRSYGYTAGLPISVLTNFRTFRVYDTRLEPGETDSPDTALMASIEYRDLPSQLDRLTKCFSRDQVASGSIEREFKVTLTGAIPVNISFLNRINGWRVRMAQDLHSRYPTLVPDDLNDFTQKIINRIIFIRMCEDRGIEGEAVLHSAAGRQDFVELRTLFKRMDTRYNTGLFDASRDRLQDTYKIDAELFLAIVNEIYAPNSPYNFGLLDADFFGEVYEHFLVKHLNFDDTTGNVVLQDKPVYEHREIVTTPQPLVNEVVHRAFDSKFEQLAAHGQISFEAIRAIRVLDVAVGSGRFLLQAFNELVNMAVKSLLLTNRQPHLYRVTDDEYRLDFQTKSEILKSCLYGIDIDYGAVEVARFSLLVRLLEDETSNTLPTGRKILPNLDKNIVCGNTVVRQDFPITFGSVFDRTLPLDWSSGNLPEAFDVVIGNPPYLKTEEMRQIHPEEMDYYKRTYKTPYKQFDKYFIFIELALSRLKSDGWFGMVVPNKWITNDAGSNLREILAEHRFVAEILDFGNEMVFEGRSTYVCLLILAKSGVDAFAHRSVSLYREFLSTPHEKGIVLPSALLATFGRHPWVLPSSDEEAVVLKKLMLNSIRLSEIANVKNGIQTSANDVFVLSDFTEHEEFVEFDEGSTHWKIEKDTTRSFIDDSQGVISYRPIVADARVIFPYESSPSGTIGAIIPSRLSKHYPLTWAYLSAHKTRLEDRDVSPVPPRGVFYAFGRDQALETVFTTPKIVYSVAQRGDKYAVDMVGAACASGGTAGEAIVCNPRRGYTLEFILGLLNQKAIEFFLRKRGSPFRGGFFSRGTDVLSDVPVPLLDINGNALHKAAHDAIVADVRALIQIQKKLQTASGRKRISLDLQQEALKTTLETKFNALWGFSDEIDSLQLPGDTN